MPFGAPSIADRTRVFDSVRAASRRVPRPTSHFTQYNTSQPVRTCNIADSLPIADSFGLFTSENTALPIKLDLRRANYVRRSFSSQVFVPASLT